MKKAITLGLVMLLIISCGIACAERIKGKDTDKLFYSIQYDNEYGSLKTECENGLTIEFSGLVKCYMQDYYAENNSNSYWFKAGVMGVPFTIGVQGIIVDLHNTTDKMMIIKWAESSLSLGSFYGMPFLPGMKYQDAGNPSATPDTIIPPGGTVTQTLYISHVSFSDGNWVQGYAYVRADNSLKSAIYMKVLDPSGNSTYCSAESPSIIIPEKALEPFRKKK